MGRPAPSQLGFEIFWVLIKELWLLMMFLWPPIGIRLWWPWMNEHPRRTFRNTVSLTRLSNSVVVQKNVLGQSLEQFLKSQSFDQFLTSLLASVRTTRSPCSKPESRFLFSTGIRNCRPRLSISLEQISYHTSGVYLRRAGCRFLAIQSLAISRINIWMRVGSN